MRPVALRGRHCIRVPRSVKGAHERAWHGDKNRDSYLFSFTVLLLRVMLPCCMPRTARIVVPGWPHHVTQRGNNRQTVFFTEEDRSLYLRVFGAQCRRHGVVVLGYCLMGNHVHHVLVPRRPEALARAMGRTHLIYAQYLNRRRRRSGHVWQNRFFSAAFEWPHLPAVMRYAECNPLRARLCRSAAAYRWSSAAAHCGRRDVSGLLDLKRWRRFVDCQAWPTMLNEPLDPRQVELIRARTHTGRPMAGPDALAKLEAVLGFRLHTLPRGRPPKKRRAIMNEGAASGARDVEPIRQK